VNDQHGIYGFSYSKIWRFLLEAIRTSDVAIRYAARIRYFTSRTTKQETIHFLSRLRETLITHGFLKSKHLHVRITVASELRHFRNGKTSKNYFSADNAMYVVKKAER